MDIYILFQLKLVVIIFLLGIGKCSQVLDSNTQQGLFVSEYCKRIGVCPEGTHVMCTHFNPNRTKGPLCAGARNETITPEYAKLILDLLNLIKSRSAYGTTLGLSNLTLPRAYGMYRLQWDPELSTLAQVWANTCIVSYDVCHATKRFPDPGQIAGLTRFDADWIPIDARRLFNYTGFSLEKVKYGIHSTLRSWYRTKEIVHPEDIINTNDIWPKHLGRNIFLKIVHGRSTHVGCGISIFEEFDYQDSVEHKVKLVHNVVRIVCNLSSRLVATARKDRVYTVDPPTQVGYTVKCGCPIGFDEDEDCLCYRSGSKPFSCKSKNCKPAVVILPIFKVEKAPPKSVNSELREVRVSNRKMMANEIDADHLDVDNTRARRHNLKDSIFLQSSVFVLPPRKLKSTESTNVTKSVNIFNDNTYLTRNPKKHLDLKLSNNKLMTLLNQLEEEAKIVQIASDRKDILDYKIRKIYKTFVEKAFPSKTTENRNEYRYRTQSVDDFTKNDSNTYEEQFNTSRKQNFNKMNGNNPTPFKQGFNEHFLKINLLDAHKPQNYTSSDELLAIRNIHEYRNMKGRKSNDFKNKNSLSLREDDLLTLEKRKLYQDKLNNLGRRLRNVYNHKSKNKVYADQHQRRMLPTYHERQLRNRRLNSNKFLEF